mgnify:CR=1 FL=1
MKREERTKMQTIKNLVIAYIFGTISKIFCSFFGEPKISNLKYVRILCTDIL